MEVTEFANVVRRQESKFRTGDHANAELSELRGNFLTQVFGVAGGRKDLIGLLDDRDIKVGVSVCEFAGEFDTDGATTD